MNIYKDIKNSTDLNYLKELDKYVDMDIENVGNESDVIKKMKLKIHNLSSIEEMEKKQIDGLMNLKHRIKKRIQELENGK